ncbi:hypothetical protein [Flavobacterium difficile]|uniref:Uncharacterized protein n=1 Tax=Flavobacterium difficile TaxID=2709659 RepID=A0ABX0I9D0_9FLAO|nr:hypothetical protein [Flavobacterium difficile]NHM02803.1 hypothetical protein [Flavobacterium difficile]
MYLKNQLEFSKGATDTKKVKELLSDGKLDESEIDTYFKVFSTDETKFTNYIKLQNSLYTSLNDEYNLGEISQETLIPIIEEIYIKDLLPFEERSTCKQKYIRDITSAAALALIEHGGCIALDLTVVAGIICHSAVSLIQWNSGQDALDAYHACFKK